MDINKKQQTLLRMLPGIDHIIELAKSEPFFDNIPKSVLARSARYVVENLRTSILDDSPDITDKNLTDSLILENVKKSVTKKV